MDRFIELWVIYHNYYELNRTKSIEEMYDNEIFRFGRNPVATKTKKSIIINALML